MGGIPFDRFEKRVLLKGRLQLLSGLHIGTGRETSGLTGSDLPVIKDFRGMPFIPGSSFKGVLRSGVEAFLRAFKDEEDRGIMLSCDVNNDASRCISNSRKKKIMEQKDEYSSQDPDLAIWRESCCVCRLFGSPWLASRVQVLDMPVDTSSFLPEWLMIRDGVVIDRETGTAARGKKYDFEVVPAQTCFHLEIMVDNPAEYQMGLLVLGFDFFDRGFSLLGGNTSRGLGRIRILIEKIEEQTAESIFQNLAPPAAVNDEEIAEENNQSGADHALPAENGGSPAAMVCSYLADGESKDADELIAMMQQQGWNKATLRQMGYKNWKTMFHEMVQAGQLVKVEENRYQSASATAKKETEQPATKPEEQEQKEIIENRMKEWRQALWHKLNELKGKEGA